MKISRCIPTIFFVDTKSIIYLIFIFTFAFTFALAFAFTFTLTFTFTFALTFTDKFIIFCQEFINNFIF
jgi:hypothetical protein